MSIIAFDFDGTLVNTMPSLRELAIDVIHDLVPDHPGELEIGHRYDATAGEPFYRQLKTILPLPYSNDTLDAVADEYEKRKQSLMTDDVQVFDDVRMTLLRLVAHGHHLWIVSSTKTRLIVNSMDYFLWKYFDGCMGDEYGHKAEKLMRLRADFFVGDTNRDRKHAEDATRWGEKECQFVGIRRDPRLLDADESYASDMLTVPERFGLVP